MVGCAKRGWICQEVNGELAKIIKPRLHGYNCLSGSGEENFGTLYVQPRGITSGWSRTRLFKINLIDFPSYTASMLKT